MRQGHPGAKIVELILVVSTIGGGDNAEDPVRRTFSLFRKDGEEVCYFDPIDSSESRSYPAVEEL